MGRIRMVINSNQQRRVSNAGSSSAQSYATAGSRSRERAATASSSKFEGNAATTSAAAQQQNNGGIASNLREGNVLNEAGKNRRSGGKGSEAQKASPFTNDTRIQGKMFAMAMSGALRSTSKLKQQHEAEPEEQRPEEVHPVKAQAVRNETPLQKHQLDAGRPRENGIASGEAAIDGGKKEKTQKRPSIKWPAEAEPKVSAKAKTARSEAPKAQTQQKSAIQSDGAGRSADQKGIEIGEQQKDKDGDKSEKKQKRPKIQPPSSSSAEADPHKAKLHQEEHPAKAKAASSRKDAPLVQQENAIHPDSEARQPSGNGIDSEAQMEDGGKSGGKKRDKKSLTLTKVAKKRGRHEAEARTAKSELDEVSVKQEDAVQPAAKRERSNDTGREQQFDEDGGNGKTRKKRSHPPKIKEPYDVHAIKAKAARSQDEMSVKQEDGIQPVDVKRECSNDTGEQFDEDGGKTRKKRSHPPRVKGPETENKNEHKRPNKRRPDKTARKSLPTQLQKNIVQPDADEHIVENGSARVKQEQQAESEDGGKMEKMQIRPRIEGPPLSPAASHNEQIKMETDEAEGQKDEPPPAEQVSSASGAEKVMQRNRKRPLFKRVDVAFNVKRESGGASHAAPRRHPRILISREGEKLAPFFTNAFAFSNHFMCRFTVDGTEFNCTEQFYMYYKAHIFGDGNSANSIMFSQDSKAIKRMGARIRLFNTGQWRQVSILVMVIANWAKYEQNPMLRQCLFNTGDATLVEASPDDIYWGIGIHVDSPANIRDTKSWRAQGGKNVMGRILTRIRDTFKRKFSDEWEEVRAAKPWEAAEASDEGSRERALARRTL